MKKQQIEENKYPSYVLLPWEEDEVVNYAKLSHLQFKEKKDERDEKHRILDARLGIGGELAFKNLLTVEKQLLILDHSGTRGSYGAAYDFKVKGSDKEYTIDVKTTLKSDKVPSPEKCNFLWSKRMQDVKSHQHIPLCDIYVQMLYDPDEFIYYFIGAISLDKIKSIGYGVNIMGDLRLIRQSEMDYTNTFLSYIDKKYKTFTRLI